MCLKSDRAIKEACFVFDLALDTGQIGYPIGDLVPDAVIFVSRSVLVRRCPFEAYDQWIQLDHAAVIVELADGHLPRNLPRKRGDVGVNCALRHRDRS